MVTSSHFEFWQNAHFSTLGARTSGPIWGRAPKLYQNVRGVSIWKVNNYHSWLPKQNFEYNLFSRHTGGFHPWLIIIIFKILLCPLVSWIVYFCSTLTYNYSNIFAFTWPTLSSSSDPWLLNLQSSICWCFQSLTDAQTLKESWVGRLTAIWAQTFWLFNKLLFTPSHID